MNTPDPLPVAKPRNRFRLTTTEQKERDALAQIIIARYRVRLTLALYGLPVAFLLGVFAEWWAAS
jgi:hypothetical protein